MHSQCVGFAELLVISAPMGRNVLIVDDDPVNSYVLERTVRAAGFNALPAISAQDAQSALRSNQLDVPAIILLGASEAKGRGAHFLLEIKHSGVLGTVPIVVVTGAPELAKAFGDVANAVLVKPFDVWKLAEELKRLGT